MWAGVPRKVHHGSGTAGKPFPGASGLSLNCSMAKALNGQIVSGELDLPALEKEARKMDLDTLLKRLCSLPGMAILLTAVNMPAIRFFLHEWRRQA